MIPHFIILSKELAGHGQPFSTPRFECKEWSVWWNIRVGGEMVVEYCNGTAIAEGICHENVITVMLIFIFFCKTSPLRLCEVQPT